MSTKNKSVAVKPAQANDIDAEIKAVNERLAALNEQRVRQEKENEQKQKDMIAGLPAQFGVESVPALLRLIQKVSGVGKRAKVTDEMRARVKVLSDEGKTGAQIADTLGVSGPTVQNIRKKLGLVKARKAK